MLPQLDEPYKTTISLEIKFTLCYTGLSPTWEDFGLIWAELKLLSIWVIFISFIGLARFCRNTKIVMFRTWNDPEMPDDFWKVENLLYFFQVNCAKQLSELSSSVRATVRRALGLTINYFLPRPSPKLRTLLFLTSCHTTGAVNKEWDHRKNFWPHGVPDSVYPARRWLPF